MPLCKIIEEKKHKYLENQHSSFSFQDLCFRSLCFTFYFSQNSREAVSCRKHWMFIEGQASSRPYDLAPASPPPSPVSELDWRLTGRLRKRDILLPGGAVEEPSHMTARKPMNHSILSGVLIKLEFFISLVIFSILGFKRKS
jgi:hypothetical protein